MHGAVHIIRIPTIKQIVIPQVHVSNEEGTVGRDGEISQAITRTDV